MTYFAIGLVSGLLAGILLSILNVLYFKKENMVEIFKKVKSVGTDTQAKIVSIDDPIKEIIDVIKQ